MKEEKKEEKDVGRRGKYVKCIPDVPEFVYDNVDSMRTIRRTLRWKQSYVVQKSGISPSAYVDYEFGLRLPDKESYNKLAKIFDWEEWA